MTAVRVEACRAMNTPIKKLEDMTSIAEAGGFAIGYTSWQWKSIRVSLHAVTHITSEA